MNILQRTRSSLLIGLAVMSLAGSVHAADRAPEPGRHGHAVSAEQQAERQAARAEHMAKRQARLHDALKLTPAQEPAWTSFKAAHQKAPRAERPDRAALASLPAPQRMEQRMARAKQHIAAMETRLAALNSFYGVLTPEQKKVFDEQVQRGGRMHRHGKRHGGALS